MIVITARAATLVTGLPPKVQMVGGVYASAISALSTVRPTGCPLPSDLAAVIMSGSTSQCSIPNHFLPVRPQPVCTSSEMKSPPYCFTILKTILKYSLGGVMNPPTPWMGSAIIPAIRPDVEVWMTCSTSLAQATPQEG